MKLFKKRKKKETAAFDVDYVIGIDGGGTRSHGLAMSLKGDVLGEVEGGPLNYHTTGDKVFQESLEDLWAKLKCFSSGDCFLMMVGTAALFEHPTPVDQERLESMQTNKDLPPVLFMGDACAAAIGALGGEPGVVVISGTGSIAISILDDLVTTNGGLGPVIDNDPGSALWMASQAVTRCQIGTDSSSRTLESAIYEYFGIRKLNQIVEQIYKTEGNDTGRLAGLAAYLAEHRGDNPIWKGIETDAGVCLAGLATPLCGSFKPEVPVFIPSGSVLENNGRVRKSMLRTLGKNLKTTRPLEVEPPFAGAAHGAAVAAIGQVASENPE